MKEWIKEKIEEINKIYPPERVAKSKERFERLYRGEKPIDRYPFTYGHLSSDYHAVPPPPELYEARLRECLDEIILRGVGKDDFIPALPTGCNSNNLPSMFGSKEVISGDDHSSERILFKPEDIDTMPEPSIKPGTTAYNVLKYQEYLLEATEGCLPIHTMDMQEPFSVGAMMMGYDNFYLLSLDDPNRFHKLMSKTTDAFIMFVKHQIEVAGDLLIRTNLWDWDWAPGDVGISCDIDSIVMISPEYYDEFYKPYFVRIGKAFGGIILHSCGSYLHLIEKITNTPFVRALNTTQQKVQDIVNANCNKNVVISAGGTLYYPTVDKIEEAYVYIKENNINAYLTYLYHWPRIWRDNKPIFPWTTEELMKMKEDEERILRAVSM